MCGGFLDLRESKENPPEMLVGLSSTTSSPSLFLSTGWNQSLTWLDPTTDAVNVVDNALASRGSTRETWRTTKRALPPFSQSIRKKRRKTLLWTENDKLRRWDGSTERESLLLSSIKRRRSSTVGGILLSCIVLLPLFYIIISSLKKKKEPLRITSLHSGTR